MNIRRNHSPKTEKKKARNSIILNIKQKSVLQCPCYMQNHLKKENEKKKEKKLPDDILFSSKYIK